MIGRLRGIILEKQPPLVLLETGGVGYEVHMPMTCFYELPDAGKEAIIFTQFVVREDAQLLYGFNNKQERMLFRELIKTNGVGPKLALAILSGMSAHQFVNAVEREDPAALIKLPGIGKKTAERLVLELKDKVATLSFDHKTADKAIDTSARVDVYAALIALGYAEKEINHVLKNFPNDMDVNNGIRWALQQFSK